MVHSNNNSLRGNATEVASSTALLTAVPTPSAAAIPVTVAPSAVGVENTIAPPPLSTNPLPDPTIADDMPDLFEPEGYSHSMVVRCIAEFVATLVFVFVGVAQAGALAQMPISTFAPMTTTNAPPLDNASWTETAAAATMKMNQTNQTNTTPSVLNVSDDITHSALAHGIAIFLLACVFGGISGAHMNPAVTLGVMLVGQLDQLTCLLYICCQFGGALLGALLGRGVMDITVYKHVGGGCAMLAAGSQWYQGVLGETMTTFFLVLTVLITAIDPRKNLLAPLAIGFCVSAGIFAVGHVSGGAMNPARALGPTIVASAFLDGNVVKNTLWQNHWIYFVGPCVGSGIAAALYRAFFATDERLLH